MGKSKYPSKLDSSVEIPAVRDNILEVGSDAINSLRHAIFQIERTLGINPQGASGNTVADRINTSLDGNGNIKKEALNKANILSGPISDSDVSKTASIKESKLKLNFSTNLLQSQISTLNNEIGSLLSKIDEINLALSVHLNENAKNRHSAVSISVNEDSISESSTSANSLASGTVQEAFETIYDGHINFSGENISSDNKSHSASQIYFDNSNVTDLSSSSESQSAIEDALLLSSNSEIKHQKMFHTNSILRIGDMDSVDSSSSGPIISEDLQVSFSANAGTANTTFTITFINPFLVEGFSLETSDLVILKNINDSTSSLNGQYEISKINKNINNEITSVEVFGIVDQDSNSAIRATIAKNLRRKTNESSLLVAAREDSILTSTKVLQVCNPNSVRVISKNVSPAEITSTNKTLTLTYGTKSIDLNVYEPSASRQSIDTIISRMNEAFAEQSAFLLAYRLDKEFGKSEIVIAHNLPDDSTSKYTITVSRGSDDGIDALGFSDIEDKVISSEYGSPYYILGQGFESLPLKLDTTSLSFFEGLRTVDVGSSDINFEDLGVQVGDIIHIENVPDEGSYVIESVTGSFLTIDSGQLPSGFNFASGDGGRFRIFASTINIENVNFKKINNSFGASVFELFYNKDRNLFAQTVIEYSATLNGNNNLVEIVDYEGELEEETLSILVTNDSTNGVNISLDSGQAVNVIGKENYVWVYSGQKNVAIKILIEDADEVGSYININGNISISVETFKEVNKSTNLKIANVPYANFNGRVIGGANSSPRIYAKTEKGSVSDKEIGSSVYSKVMNTPIQELRSNGVVRGLEILTASIVNNFYSFNISSGVAYVRGKRFEIESGTYLTDINSLSIDKIFIYVDEEGNIGFGSSLTGDCLSPVNNSSVAILGTIEYDSINIKTHDLRLIVDNIDGIVLNAVTVSPQPGLAHFSSISDALAYAKRFSQIYPSAGVPTVHLKSGVYNVTMDIDNSSDTELNWYTTLSSASVATTSEFTTYSDAIFDQGIFIDFPVVLEGEGDSSVIKVRVNSEYSDVSREDQRGMIYVIGAGFETQSTRPFTPINDGTVTIKNVKFDNCGIQIFDFNIEDLSGLFPVYLDIDTCTFLDNKGSAIAGTLDKFHEQYGIFEWNVGTSSLTTRKGNFLIRNCRFINSEIYHRDDKTYRYNRIYSNNVIMGNSSGNLITSDGIELADLSEQQNITFIGNTHFSNFDTTDAVSGPDLSPSDSWKDRISRNLLVGNDLEVGKNLDVANRVTSSDYYFDTQKTVVQVYDWQAVSNPNLESVSTNNVTFSTVFISGSGDWYYASIPASDTARMPVPRIPHGATISRIDIGVSNPGVNWTVDIVRKPLVGVVGSDTILETQTSTGIGFLRNPYNVYFTGFSSVVDSNNFLYYIDISHNNAGALRSYWVKISLTYSNIDNILGNS